MKIKIKANLDVDGSIWQTAPKLKAMGFLAEYEFCLQENRSLFIAIHFRKSTFFDEVKVFSSLLSIPRRFAKIVLSILLKTLKKE